MDRHIRPNAGILVTATVLATTSSTARAVADEIRFRNAPAFTDVQILQLHNSQVRFRLTQPAVRTLEKPITELVFMQITGATDLNRAERYVAEKKNSGAIPLYERALRRFNEPWKKSLVRARLVSAYDRTGRFDRAVETFVQLVNELGIGALGLEPKNFPGPKSRYRAAALATLNEALKTERKPRVAEAIQALRKAVQENRANAAPKAGGAKPPKGDAPAANDRRTRTATRLEASRLAQIEETVKAKQHAAAKEELDAFMRTASTASLPTAQRLGAQVALQTAKSRDDLLGAGVQAMRVVVRFPDHRECPVCLFIAARVHERIGRRKLAASLLQECRSHAAVTSELSKRAEEALAQLEAADPS